MPLLLFHHLYHAHQPTFFTMPPLSPTSLKVSLSGKPPLASITFTIPSTRPQLLFPSPPDAFHLQHLRSYHPLLRQPLKHTNLTCKCLRCHDLPNAHASLYPTLLHLYSLCHQQPSTLMPP